MDASSISGTAVLHNQIPRSTTTIQGLCSNSLRKHDWFVMRRRRWQRVWPFAGASISHRNFNQMAPRSSTTILRSSTTPLIFARAPRTRVAASVTCEPPRDEGPAMPTRLAICQRLTHGNLKAVTPRSSTSVLHSSTKVAHDTKVTCVWYFASISSRCNMFAVKEGCNARGAQEEA